MVIIKLMGGLGNQMFQYAFALVYLLKGKDVKFDLSYYNIDNSHGGYWLDKAFDINIFKATKKDIFHFIEKVDNGAGDVAYQLKADRHIVNEENEFSCNEDWQMPDNKYFIGYWLNMNYFIRHTEMVKSKFSFKEIAHSYNLVIEERIRNTNSVSIHVRRGNYLASPVHINLNMEYYAKAIDLVINKIENPYFFVFSDDITWVKSEFSLTDVCFVENHRVNQSHVDLHLISLCKHNITVNSTFSWWGAWLDSTPRKMVVAPIK